MLALAQDASTSGPVLHKCSPQEKSTTCSRRALWASSYPPLSMLVVQDLSLCSFADEAESDSREMTRSLRHSRSHFPRYCMTGHALAAAQN